MKSKFFLLSLLLCFTFQYQLKAQVLILQPDATVGEDAFINSNFPSNNYGSHPGLHSGGWTWSGSFGIVRSFVKFDLSSIPTNATIFSATLSLHNDPDNNIFLTNGQHSNLTASNTSYVRRVTGPWDENTLNWNNQPPSVTTNQTLLTQSTNPNQDYLNIDVKDMVQDMVLNPANNHGFVIRLQTETFYAGLILASSDDPDRTNHPRLEVTYEVLINQEDPLSEDIITTVYPNPSTGAFQLALQRSLSDPVITVFNELGQTVYVQQYEPSQQIDLDLDLSAGIYFVRLQSELEGVNSVEKIVVE